jgi:hypothetical protein
MIELRSERTDLLLEFGVLALKALLFRFDLYEVGSDAFDDAVLVRDDAALLCYNFFQICDKPRDFL